MKIKNKIVYIPKDKINNIISILRKLNINYYFDNLFHNFINNNYEMYYEYAYKKYDLEIYIGDLWKIN